MGGEGKCGVSRAMGARTIESDAALASASLPRCAAAPPTSALAAGARRASAAIWRARLQQRRCGGVGGGGCVGGCLVGCLGACMGGCEG